MAFPDRLAPSVMSGAGVATRPYSAAGSQGMVSSSSPAGIPAALPFPPPLFYEAAQRNAARPFNSVAHDPAMASVMQAMAQPKFVSDVPLFQRPDPAFSHDLTASAVAPYFDDEEGWMDPHQVKFTFAHNGVEDGTWSPRSDSEDSADSGDSAEADEERRGPLSHPYYSNAPPGTPTVRYHTSYLDSFGNEPASFEVEGNGREVVQGFQVIKLAAGSPAQRAGLLPFFDFLVAADDVPLTDDVQELAQRLASKRGEGVLVSVYNARQRAVRQVAVYPDDHWGDGGLFGCTIIWNEVRQGFLSARQVTDVNEQFCKSNPPLLPGQHFVIGMEEFPSTTGKRICCFSTPDEFEHWVEQHRSNPAAQQDGVQLLVVDAKENIIFSTRVPNLAYLGVAAPLQSAIPYGDSVPLYPEGGPVARSVQKTGKKTDQKAAPSPGVAQAVPSTPPRPDRPLPPEAGVAGGSPAKLELYHGVLMRVSFATMLCILALFVAWCLAVGIYSIVVFALTRKSAGNPNLSLWLIVYGARTVVLLPFCALFFTLLEYGKLRRQDPVVQLWRLFVLLGVLFAIAWLVLGTVWVFSQPTLRNEWGFLYWSCLAVVITEYVHHSVWVCSLFFQAFDEMD
eukprot:EG_transcript_6453